jgi:hypothetical protein
VRAVKAYMWGERGKAGEPGQRPGTATTHPPAHPRPRHDTPRARSGGQRPQKTGQRAGTEGGRAEARGTSRGASPRSEEDSTERRARANTQRTHPPGTPAERRKEPAVRAGPAQMFPPLTILVGNTRELLPESCPANHALARRSRHLSTASVPPHTPTSSAEARA